MTTWTLERILSILSTYIQKVTSAGLHMFGGVQCNAEEIIAQSLLLTDQ